MTDAAETIGFEYLRLPNRRSTFLGEVLEAGPERLVLAHLAHPSRPLVLHGQEVLAEGYWVIWFLYKGRPWDVGRFYRPDGQFTGFYADVLQPVHWEMDRGRPVLEPLVDLFLDLWIEPDGTPHLLDEEELEEAVRGGALEPERGARARAVADDLLAATAAGLFPPPEVRAFRHPTKT